MFTDNLDEINYRRQDELSLPLYLDWYRYIAEDIPNEECFEVEWLFA